MKNSRIVTFVICFLLFSSAGFAQQKAKSDYEIQKKFKLEYKKFQLKLKHASSADSMQAVIDSIRVFENSYQEHADLLDQALYPDTFDEKMQDLKENSVLTKDRLTRIKNQSQEVKVLKKKLTGYERQLQALNRQTDSLQQLMQKSAAGEKRRLQAVVKNYRKSLEQRDELILGFIDSMVVAYKEMDLHPSEDMENVKKESRLNSGKNALKVIQDISRENLDILQKNNGNLRLEDYMRMSEVQNQFAQMWTRLGDKMKQVYDVTNADKIGANIEQNIKHWNDQLNQQTIAALNDSLKNSNIGVDHFDDSKGFYTSLNAYLDHHIDGTSTANYDKLQQFREFWDDTQIQWPTNFVDAGLLSRDEMATINKKVTQWSEKAKPESDSNLFLYLLGGSILIVIILIVLLIRERKRDNNIKKMIDRYL